jgi:hypothetical protein
MRKGQWEYSCQLWALQFPEGTFDFFYLSLVCSRDLLLLSKATFYDNGDIK